MAVAGAGKYATQKPRRNCGLYLIHALAVFIPEDALSVWTNYLLLCSRSRRTTEDSSSRRIIRLVPVFILETHNPSNIIGFNGAETNCGIAHILGILLMNSYDFRYFRYFNTQQLFAVCSLRIKCVPKFVQTDTASSSIKRPLPSVQDLS